MGIASFFVPNFNLDALIGLFIAIIGVLMFIASTRLNFLPNIQKRMITLSVFLVLGGLAYWIGFSFLQDLVKSTKTLVVAIAVVVVGAIGFLLFKKKKNS